MQEILVKPEILRKPRKKTFRNKYHRVMQVVTNDF